MKYILSIFILLFSWNGNSQNLVTNPSFEIYSSCPTTFNEIDKAIGWSSFSSSPDYLNSCSSNTNSVPYNSMGFQHAATGNAYANIFCYSSDSSWNEKEIIGDSLISPLIVGQKYFISFKANRPDKPSTGKSINKLGAKFSTIKYTTLMPAPIDNYAHIYSNSVISDTANWTKITGSFIADSSYNYLMIGLFFDDNNITIVNDGIGYDARYFIDDVCVSTDSNLCYNFVGVSEKAKNFSVNISPNPSFGNYNITSTYNIEEYAIYTNVGQLLQAKTINSKSLQLNLSEYSSGIYFIHLKTDEGIIRKKLMLN